MPTSLQRSRNSRLPFLNVKLILIYYLKYILILNQTQDASSSIAPASLVEDLNPKNHSPPFSLNKMEPAAMQAAHSAAMSPAPWPAPAL